MAWGKWYEFAVERREQEKRLRAAMRRFINQKLSQAYNKWKDTAAALARQTYMLKGAYLLTPGS